MGTIFVMFSIVFVLKYLMDEHWNFSHGYEPLFWISANRYVPSPRVVTEIPQMSVDLSNSELDGKWMDKEPLRELEQKEQEVGNLLE